MTTQIRYGTSEDAWEGYAAFVEATIRRFGIKRVLEVGGGAHPTLTRALVRRHGLHYTVVDISEAELSKAPEYCEKRVADVASPRFSVEVPYDLVVSKMFLEHVRDAERFHRTMRGVVADGGLIVHFIPTLYSLPFLVNALLPERLSDALLGCFCPRDRTRHAKFPAYYDWCRGPTRRQIRRYERLGYEVLEYAGFFGHAGYYRKLGAVRKLHEWKTALLLRNPVPWLTSYAYVVLRKDENSARDLRKGVAGVPRGG